jgi:hypothetical protein
MYFLHDGKNHPADDPTKMWAGRMEQSRAELEVVAIKSDETSALRKPDDGAREE